MTHLHAMELQSTEAKNGEEKEERKQSSQEVFPQLEHAQLTPNGIEYSNAQLDEALETNNTDLALIALTNGADANGISRRAYYDHLTYSISMNVCPKIIKALLAYKANPNVAISPLEESPLHRAHTPYIAQLLIQYGADINAVDSMGKNVLYYNNIRDNNTQNRPTAETYELIKILIDNKANPNHVNNNGETPLHQTATAHRPEYIQALLEGKADVLTANSEGNTALYLAVKTKKNNNTVVKTVQLLVNATADPYITEKSGFSPLDIASIRSSKITDALIEAFNEKQKAK